jgi:hypothetical protein
MGSHRRAPNGIGQFLSPIESLATPFPAPSPRARIGRAGASRNDGFRRRLVSEGTRRFASEMTWGGWSSALMASRADIRWRELPGITPHGPSDGENLPALLATANAAAAVPARARPALASAWSSLYVGPASNLSTSSRRHHEPPRSLGFIHPRPHIYNRRVIAFGFPDQHSRRGARWSSSSGVRSYTPSPLPRGTARRQRNPIISNPVRLICGLYLTGCKHALAQRKALRTALRG